MKKIIALLLAALLIASTCAFAMAEEPITITVMGPQGTTRDWDATHVFQELEKKFNVNFEVTTFADDVWKTQFTLMLAEDNLPDIFMQCDMNKAEINGYGEDGYFLDLSQYMDIMPSFAAFCESHPDFAAYTATAEGKIYSVNRCRDTVQSRQLSHNWIKKSWLENVNKEVPTTIEELYDVLVAFKEQDANGNGDPNDEIPMAITIDGQSGQRVEFALKAAFGIYNVNHNFQLAADENGKVYLYETTENWKEYLTFMNKLYEEGLLDNEAFTMTTAEFRAKASADQVGFFGDWSNLASCVGAADDFVNRDYELIISFANKDSGLQTVSLYPNYTAGARLMVNALTEVPEKICEIIDYLYSDEGIMLVNYGTEGVTFNYIEDEFGNKAPDVTPYWQAMIDQYPTMSEWQQQYLYPNNVTSLVVYDYYSAVMEDATDEELDAYIAYEGNPNYIRIATWEKAVREADLLVDAFPFLAMTAEETDTLGTLTTDMAEYLKTMKAQFITGEIDIETEWDNFQATLQGMGLETVLEVNQAAYDRFLAAMGD
ncbi:MAG: extracellular solute-binding protein [Clostridia bacterium]|nr:extracellular solute-binding protein [Clostridia bacterium]